MFGRLKEDDGNKCGQEIDGMIHARHLHGSLPKNGGPAPGSSRRREIFVAAEASLSAVRRAKRAAGEPALGAPCARTAYGDEQYLRCNEHQRHGEPLFEALCRLDAAREALRSMAPCVSHRSRDCGSAPKVAPQADRPHRAQWREFSASGALAVVIS